MFKQYRFQGEPNYSSDPGRQIFNLYGAPTCLGLAQLTMLSFTKTNSLNGRKTVVVESTGGINQTSIRKILTYSSPITLLLSTTVNVNWKGFERKQ